MLAIDFRKCFISLLAYSLWEVIMARPREGDNIKRTIRTVGDKKYAYEITSKMVDGRKKTVSKYLGRIDPETGELLEKIPEKSSEYRQKIKEQRTAKVLDGIKVGDYGGVYLLDHIQRKIGLGDDLTECFGMLAQTIVGITVTLVQCDGVFDAVEGRMRRTWTKEFYGLKGSLDSGTLSRLLKDVGQGCEANVEKYFRLRMKRNSDRIVAWDTTTKGTNTEMEGMAEYVVNNKDNEELKQVKVALATDDRGVPILFRTYAGNVSDMDTVREMSRDISELGGKDVIFVMDRGFSSGANTKEMLDMDVKFVMGANTGSRAVKALLSRFHKSKERTDEEYDGHMYSVMESDLGLILEEGRRRANGEPAYRFTVAGEEGHGRDGMLKAFVCFDSKKYSDETQTRRKLISDLKKKATKIDSDHPIEDFKALAGKAIRYFDTERDGRKVKVTERSNSLSFAENRAGLFVLLAAPGVSWGAAMLAYDARRLTEQAYDRDKGTNPRFGTGDLESMRGREFLRFLSLTMKCEISAEIREAKADHTVESVVSMADCVRVKELDGVTRIGIIDKKEREVFALFGAELPKSAERDLFVGSV